MGDVWAKVAEASKETQEMLADAMEKRSEDPVFTGLRDQNLQWLDPCPGGVVVEMGCGPGDVTRALLAQVGAREAIGIDPSPVMIERAAARHADMPHMRFQVDDARDTSLDAGSVDLVIYHTTLCHVPEPERALAEAARILRPGGKLMIFDGDYTTTAHLGPDDPVGRVVDYAMEQLVHDLYFCRTLQPRLRDAGFQPEWAEVLPYLAEGNAAFFVSLIDRGCVLLEQAGEMDKGSLATIRAEAEARIETGRFFGFTAFHGVLSSRTG